MLKLTGQSDKIPLDTPCSVITKITEIGLSSVGIRSIKGTNQILYSIVLCPREMLKKEGENPKQQLPFQNNQSHLTASSRAFPELGREFTKNSVFSGKNMTLSNNY